MEFDDYPFMESYNDEEFVFRFINDFDWDPSTYTSDNFLEWIGELPWNYIIANPDDHSSVLQHMIKRGCRVKHFNQMIGYSLFSSKLIVPFGLILTCIDGCKWEDYGDLEEEGWANVDNVIEYLEYFLELAPEAVESADPSTGELIIQKLHRIASVYSSDITKRAFELLIKAGMRPGSSLIADRAGLYRLTDVGESSSVRSQPVKSVIREGGYDAMRFLTNSDPPLLTTADIYDLDIVSFLLEIHEKWKWVSTDECFLARSH
jgi:hypothetical protein